MITKNKENKNGFQIYQDLLVDIVENLDKLVDDFYQDFFTPLLKQMEELDTLLTFKDNILETQKEKMKDAYFIGRLVEKTETRYISHNGSPDSKIFALLRDTITDFNEEDLDDTLSFDVKEKKLVLYNFIEYSSPYKNGFSLTDYPFTPGKSFSKDLKKKMEDGEDNPYTSLSVLVVKHYAGIISEEEVKTHLKTELTTTLRWLFLLANQELNLYSLMYSFPISLRDCSPLKILAEFKNTMAGNFYPQDSFERIQEVFHLTEEEVSFVLDEFDFIGFHFVR